jgi:hypothetical protein
VSCSPGSWRRGSWRGVGNVSDIREMLSAGCQVAGIVAAGLLLPAALVDLAFGSDLVGVLSQGMLAAFAIALIISVWTSQKEG